MEDDTDDFLLEIENEIIAENIILVEGQMLGGDDAVVPKVDIIFNQCFESRTGPTGSIRNRTNIRFG